MSHCVWKDDLKQIRANWGFSQIRIGFHNSRLSGLDATRRAETGFQYYTEKKKSGNEIIDLLLKLCFKNAVLLCISFNLTEKNKSTQQQSNEFPPPVCTSLASLLKPERKTTGQKVNNYHIFQTSGTPPSWSPINRALRQTVNGGAAEISDSMTVHRAEIWICGNCFGHAVLSLLWRANVPFALAAFSRVSCLRTTSGNSEFNAVWKLTCCSTQAAAFVFFTSATAATLTRDKNTTLPPCIESHGSRRLLIWDPT